MYIRHEVIQFLAGEHSTDNYEQQEGNTSQVIAESFGVKGLCIGTGQAHPITTYKMNVKQHKAILSIMATTYCKAYIVCVKILEVLVFPF